MPTDPITHLLNERIDRLEARLDARVDERHADLRERLDGLRQDVATLTGALLARLDAHDEYHRRNEHRWGLVRLAARYPFRLAGLAGASVMILSTAPEARALLLRFLEATRGFSP
jgi:hypothetical protein